MNGFKKDDVIQLDKHQTSYYWHIMLARSDQSDWFTSSYFLNKQGDCQTIAVSNSETNREISED